MNEDDNLTDVGEAYHHLLGKIVKSSLAGIERLTVPEELYLQQNRQALYLLWQDGLIEMVDPTVDVTVDGNGASVVYITNNTIIKPTKEGIETCISNQL